MTTAVTILLAEDEPMLRHLVTRILHRAGYVVQSYANGAEALAATADEPCRFQLVLTDVVMPVLNGYDLAAAVRAACPRTAVVMMTGYAPENLPRPAVLRDVPLLSKPFTHTDLLAAIEAALTRAARS
jgi:two-component system cell cycle sensor histidine kinase/response regulator CckA